MCGIVGGIAFNSKGREQFHKIESALSFLRQRGPDHQEWIKEDNFCFGHARLSILDPSNLGHQPMTDSSGRYCLIYNGEIFNFKELRHDLQEKGYTFRSHSDTEVLLNLFIDEGKSCLRKLQGFFAFAIYDKKKNSLFIARDRFGVKPLYFYQDENNFIFSSEMKSLMAFDIQRKLDLVSIYFYLQLTYIPAPYSIYEDVYKVLPGESIKVENGVIAKEKYYTTQILPSEYERLSYSEQKEKLYELMDRSVQKRLISDVPLGAFLSGGIDSSVIVALASKHVSSLKTFSIGYKNYSFHDETRYAKLVADKYKTDHKVILIDEETFEDSIPSVLDYLGEPFADSSGIAVQVLSHEVRKYVTVALSGDGADEVFAGYNKHHAEFLLQDSEQLKLLLKVFGPFVHFLPKTRDGKWSNLFRQIEKFHLGNKQDFRSRYFSWCSFNQVENVIPLFNKSTQQFFIDHKSEIENRFDFFTKDLNINDFNSILLNDVNFVLPNDMLTKVDLMSMSCSLEVRNPFLDHEVVDFAFSLPASSKIDRSIKKKILQNTFRDILPKELYNRPKQGFTVPLMGWLRKNGAFQINSIESMDIFDKDKLFELTKNLQAGRSNDTQALLWSLKVLDHWYLNSHLK